MKVVFVIGTCLFFVGCTISNPKKQWEYNKTISLDGINPIGLTATRAGLWMSDGDHNRVALIDERGSVLREIEQLDRPMHIDSKDETIYIPQYGNDRILRWIDGDAFEVQVNDTLDAPAGVSVFKDKIAIADFYNHRVLYYDGSQWVSIGDEGKEEGEFYYPTDVQIEEDRIWVADAYNNRGQAFDGKGIFQFAFGMEQKMNAATGLFVSKDQVFLTDFENDRVIVFTRNGEWVQTLDRAIDKPTDLIMWDQALYIANYRTGEVVVYE